MKGVPQLRCLHPFLPFQVPLTQLRRRDNVLLADHPAERSLFLTDCVLQQHQPLQQRLGTRRTARHVNIHRQKLVDPLIQHFLNVSWGPVIPADEASVCVEATKGLNSYYLVSDGSTMSYRTRIRTPSFPHLQMIPLMSRGLMIADLIAILASIDYVMADVDR